MINNLKKGQQTNNRSDLIARVFQLNDNEAATVVNHPKWDLTKKLSPEEFAEFVQKYAEKEDEKAKKYEKTKKKEKLFRNIEYWRER